MLVLTSHQKQTGFIWVLLLAVLLLTPLTWLNHLIGELKTRDESYLDMQARERLLNDMADFQNQLRPETYIELAVDAMKTNFGISPGDNERASVLTADVDPLLIKPEFTASAAQFFKDKFGMLPLLIVAADCDLQNYYGWYAENLFPDDSYKRNFEKIAAHWLVFKSGEIINELASTTGLNKLQTEFSSRKEVAPGLINRAFNEEFNKYISVFDNVKDSSDNCRVFFSNKFGSQRSFQIHHCITRPKGRFHSFLGGFFLIFNSADISPTFILKNTLSRVDSDLQRFYIKKPVRKPEFAYNDGYLQYSAGFPSYFFTLVEDYMIKNPVTKQKLREFIDHNGLVVQIDRKHLTSTYAKAQQACGALIKFAVLFFFALLVRSYMHDLEQGLKLAKKLRIAVAITVILPIIGVFLISEQTRLTGERLALIKYQTRIKQRMDLFEKIFDDVDPSLVLVLQEYKNLLANNYYKLEKNQTDLIRQGHFLKRNAGILETTLDKNGRPFAFSLVKGKKNNSTSKIGMFKILSDLGLTNNNAPEIKKLQKHQLMLIGIAGGLTKLFANPEELARESLLTSHILSASDLIRSSHQLIAHPKKPGRPDAIALLEIDDLNFLKQMFRLLCYNALALFSDYDENCQIDYALTLRGSMSLRDLLVPSSSRTYSDFKKLAAAGVNREASGSSLKRQQDSLLIESWFYSSVSPAMILARGKLKTISAQNPLFQLIPWALLLYALLAVILISDVLADIFLAPVNAMLNFVNRLAQNDLEGKIEIKSGDEFEELGDSFNQMNEGLRQREKMRRFVSDRLFSNIEAEGDKTRPIKTGLSVLSSDIRSFTALSEQYPPEEIVSLLNDYFTSMEEAIVQHGGSVEKIIGDAITAIFYPTSHLPEPAIRACRSALAMRRHLQLFNQQRTKESKFTIKTGIGIASGEAVMGFAAGRARKREFVLIGDAMHRAEQLEAETKYGKTSKIFIDNATAELSSMKADRITIVDKSSAYLELCDV